MRRNQFHHFKWATAKGTSAGLNLIVALESFIIKWRSLEELSGREQLAESLQNVLS